jgi:hypothetical protein
MRLRTVMPTVIPTVIRAVIRAAIVIAAVPCALADVPFTQTRTSGPQTLLIAYRTSPDHRAALRLAMVNEGVARFERWKERGVLKDYRILFNSYLDSETYDLLSLLTFASFSDVAKWREIEKTTPGGLPPEVLKLVTSAVTYPLDLARTGASQEAAARGQSVFFIIQYDYLVPTDDYVRYLDAYVVPQAKGWIAERVLAAYTMYLGRYATGRPWSSLLVLEYRDHDAFGRRESTVQKVRDALRQNPAWLAVSESKQKIRIEKQTIIAEELLAR